MMDFCVLGSGISGSTIANLLNKKYQVEVLDKAKGIGGRASTKKINKLIRLDHGLQYFSPKTREFQKYIDACLKKKILKVWKGNHIDFTFKNNFNSNKIIGNSGNNSLNKFLLNKVKIKFLQKIIKINFNGAYWELRSKDKLFKAKNIIITFPFTQTKQLARKYLSKSFLDLNIKMEPNITVLLEQKASKNIPISSIKLNDDIIAWISNENSKKRYFSKKNYWTVQTSSKYSKKTINKYKLKKKYYSNQIKRRFGDILGIDHKKLKTLLIHGWKYSYNNFSIKEKCYWNSKKRMGLCGDWFIGPNAESAWLSAHKLFDKIKKNPPK